MNSTIIYLPPRHTRGCSDVVSQLLDNPHYVCGRGHRAVADVSARQGLFHWTDDDHPVLIIHRASAELHEGGQMFTGERRLPHHRVHRRRDDHALVGIVEVPRSNDARQEVVAQSVCHLGERVGRARRDDQDVRPPSELNVKHRVPHFLPVAPLVLVLDKGDVVIFVYPILDGLIPVEEVFRSLGRHHHGVRYQRIVKRLGIWQNLARDVGNRMDEIVRLYRSHGPRHAEDDVLA
mmetsp:Transcript_10898/g.42467  ORF Transcript_10898/g.42467 Transcript_10898/m.42467 type:complete len:235 (+) Transcript_10898:165-869(+)